MKPPTVHPLVRALVALFSIAAPLLAAPDFERLGQETIAVRDGARTRRFAVARDEIGVAAPGGQTRIVKVAAAASAEAVRQRGRQPDMRAAGQTDLVLYEEGKPRTEAHRRWATARVLVKVRAGANPAAIAADVGAASFAQPGYAPGHVIFTAPAGAGNGLALAAALQRHAGIESADPLLARQAAKRFTPNDPYFADNAANAGYQWHLKNTGARGGLAGIDANVSTAWDTVRGAGVRIGIVDDGLDLAHPDLAGNIDAASDYDFNGADSDPQAEGGDDHGSAVAGVAGAVGNNALGVSGAAPEAMLVGLRLIAGPTTDADEAAAFAHRNDIIQVKNNSWGPFDSGDLIEGPGLLAGFALQDAIANGRAGKGTLLFWAAGNGGVDDNSNFDGYANSIFTIAIGAIGDDGTQSDYSESGANLLVVAPSDSSGLQGISTADRIGGEGYNDGSAPNYTDGNFTNDFGGTSSATPLAAGVAALVLQARPELTWRDVKEILIRTAKKNDSADASWDANPVLAGVQDNGAGFHFNHKYGAGLIDAAAAVALAQTWTLLPPMSSAAKSNSTVSAIPDGNATGVSRAFTFTAAETLRVESVTVSVNIAHPIRGDLEVILTAPSGTVSEMAVPRSLDFNSDLAWTFSSVRHWGESAVGTWTVTVKDRVAGDAGTLNGVTLTLYGSGASVTGAPAITSAGTAGGPAQSPFSYHITATQSPTSFGATGLPAGLTVNAVTGIISGIPATPGTSNVTLSASNAAGTGTLPLTLTIGPSLGVEVAEAVDQPALPFQTALPHAWFLQGAITHDGSDAARSAAIPHDESASFSVEITGPIVVSFWWRVSSEAVTEDGGDALSFMLDGSPVFEISGEVPWQQRLVFVDEGTHTLEWVYAKDFSVSAGLDAGFVDQVAFVPYELAPPIITVDPAPLAVAAGSFAVFSVEADSDTPLSYQWLFNNAVIPGATGRCHFFTAAAGDAGSYSCRVTNANGTIDSAAALLAVRTASGTLANAVDNTALFWSTSGDSPIWARATTAAQTHDGVDVARATGLAVGEATALETTVLGPGVVSFWWRCDGDFDFLDFEIDGESYDTAATGEPYAQVSHTVPTGLHTLRWVYYEDQDEVNVVGRGLVDQVTFVPTPFGSWQAANFTLPQRADEFISGPDADPNGDGVANLQAYAFGIHPLTGGGAPLPRALQTGSERALVYQKNTAATDVSYFVEHTADLLDELSWTDITTTETILETNGALQTIKAVLPGTVNLRDFYRLRIELTE